MLLSIAVAGLLLAAPAGAQFTVDDWLVAARAHEAGKLDEPVVALSQWPRDATFAAIDRAGRDADVDLGVLTRGLILHTDIALFQRAAGGGAAAGVGRSIRLLDTEGVASLRRTFQWDAGRRLAAILAKRPLGAPIARAWCRAVAALLQQWGDFGAVRLHLNQASDLFPDDPVLTLYRGTLHQAYADRLRFELFWPRDEAREVAVSVAWAVYALLLLALGMRRKQSGLRWASLVLLVIVIGKLFLFDLSELQGLYRVASFLGLAVSLLLVSFGYQRFVFRKSGETGATG